MQYREFTLDEARFLLLVLNFFFSFVFLPHPFLLFLFPLNVPRDSYPPANQPSLSSRKLSNRGFPDLYFSFFLHLSNTTNLYSFPICRESNCLSNRASVIVNRVQFSFTQNISKSSYYS